MNKVYGLCTLANPIKRTSASASYSWFSLSAEYLQYVGIINIASISWTRFYQVMDRNENCPTITMDQVTLSQHVSDSLTHACFLLCHQHQSVS